MRYPDYDHSVLGIPSSILRAYHADCPHQTLPSLDAYLNKNYKNVVLIVLDGLGTAILRAHENRTRFLLRHKTADISSVFPPTTTASTTTLLSGRSPVEHGWLGWSLYFDEIDRNVDIFSNVLSGTENTPAAPDSLAWKTLPYQDILAQITDATAGAVNAEGVFPFAGYRTKSSGEMCDFIRGICQKPGRNYVHAYWPDPDETIHRKGVFSAETARSVASLDAQIEALCADLRDTLVIVTADHGLIDVTYRFLCDDPQIDNLLVRPPSMEDRAMNFFIKSGEEARFVEVFMNHYGEDYALYDREEILARQLFGPGTPHPKIESLLGDYLAIAHRNLALAYAPPSYRPIFKAHHAGLHEDEMIVPLVVVDCD